MIGFVAVLLASAGWAFRWARRRAPGPTDRTLGAFALLAVLLTAVSAFSHVSRCGGVLTLLSAPPGDWQDWPIQATGTPFHRLGGFTIRGARVDYKGYPATITDAELGDPSLCFASTVSLRSWFDRDMYRTDADLTLRRAPNGGTFAVTGHFSGAAEELVSAFRRTDTPRIAFDRRDSYWFTLLSVALMSAGSLGYGLARAREQRVAEGISFPNPAGRAVAFSLFFAAALSPLLLGVRFYVSSEPRPGKEFTVHHVSP